MQTGQFWLKGACNVVTFAFANVQANFTTINTTLILHCAKLVSVFSGVFLLCAPFSHLSDLGPSFLRRLSADDTSSWWLRTQMKKKQNKEKAIIFVIYNYHYYVYAHLQSGQCMFTQSSQRIFAQYVCAHACSLISAFLHSLVSAHLLSVVSAYLLSLASAYSHSLVSAQSVLRIFTQSGQCTASASVYICSLVSAQPGQRIFGQFDQCSCCNKCVQYKMAFFLKGIVLLFWVRWILTSYKHNNSIC